ncbi:MAG: pantetheine-phosphate adenylyltransferase [Spirochaetia bacterium]|nr:pantetheine-phosphate adenylyltransferase [Spirochaetia bacterium]
MRKAVYPGSFDPLTNGHLDIIDRALEIVDHLVIAVLHNSAKKSLLTIEQRIDLISEVMKKRSNVSIKMFSGLLVDFCRGNDIKIVIRGLRAVSDFDYEHAVFLMNRNLFSKLETVFLMSSGEHSFISSTMIKEVASYGGHIADRVPDVVNSKLKEIYGKKD